MTEKVHDGFVLGSILLDRVCPQILVSVIHCSTCQFAHLKVLPTPSMVQNLYQNDRFYKVYAPSDWLEKETREHKAGLWNPYYDYQLSLLPQPMYLRPFITLLDIGTGAGWFVERARNRPQGYLAYGVEPSEQARNILKLSTVYPDIASIPNYLREFDIVHASLILEHLLDPEAALKEWGKLLKPGGKLMVVVPNDFSPLQKRAHDEEGKPYWFISPVHINYFNRLTLTNLLKCCGFSVAYETATFPMELFLFLGMNYIGNDAVGRRCHNIRLQFERIFKHHAFDLYKKLYDRFGWGRELVFVAVKTGENK